jgi:sec-independent protein translocase protein TatA
MGIENPVHLLFIAAVALIVLGPRRLPELARSLGRGIREFREAVSDGSAGSFLHDRHDGVSTAPVGGPAPAPASPAEGGVAAAGDSTQGAGNEGVAGAATGPVDPAEPVRSGDAPDRRPL